LSVQLWLAACARDLVFVFSAIALALTDKLMMGGVKAPPANGGTH
jgi:hypothetical protein